MPYRACVFQHRSKQKLLYFGEVLRQKDEKETMDMIEDKRIREDN